MRSAVLFSASLFFLCACTAQPAITLQSPDGDEEVLSVELAQTRDEQMAGLMHRTELENGSGMLFVFPDSQIRQFWMKETLIPLDIFFFDAQGKGVSVSTMVPCESDPCPLTSSNEKAMYALEVPAGYFATKDIDATWSLRLPVPTK